MKKSKVKISPSILSADFGKLNQEIADVEKHVEMLHIDVMDGHFVPNLSYGYPVAKWIKTKLPMDVDLMVQNPEMHIEAFAKIKNVDCIHIHVESVTHHHRVIQLIKDKGLKASIALNPGTALGTYEELFPIVDRVLIMGVNPGFGGQKFIDSTLEKVARIREIFPNLEIEVDGGVNAKTASKLAKAGADILVSGSYIFKSKDRLEAIKMLKGVK